MQRSDAGAAAAAHGMIEADAAAAAAAAEAAREALAHVDWMREPKVYEVDAVLRDGRRGEEDRLAEAREMKEEAVRREAAARARAGAAPGWTSTRAAPPQRPARLARGQRKPAYQE